MFDSSPNQSNNFQDLTAAVKKTRDGHLRPRNPKPLDELPSDLAGFLSPLYMSDEGEQAAASLLNAAYSDGLPCFVFSQNTAQRLVDADPNISKNPKTGKAFSVSSKSRGAAYRTMWHVLDKGMAQAAGHPVVYTKKKSDPDKKKGAVVQIVHPAFIALFESKGISRLHQLAECMRAVELRKSLRAVESEAEVI